MSKASLAFFLSLTYSSLFALSAESVYNSSAKLFAFENLTFTVNSRSTAGSSEEKRSFLVAKKSSAKSSSLLIRFKKPSDIKCTAVLVNTKNEKSTNYVYFPALKRTRVVAKKDKNSEIFGLGISYAELNSQNDTFEPLEEIMQDGVKYYKITKLKSKMKYIYFINSQSSSIEKILTYKNATLVKEIQIQNIIQKGSNSLITEWSINDFKKNKQLHYSIDEQSITSKLKSSMFHKNRLGNCTF
jgi:hypothetical protein